MLGVTWTGLTQLLKITLIQALTRTSVLPRVKCWDTKQSSPKSGKAFYGVLILLLYSIIFFSQLTWIQLAHMTGCHAKCSYTKYNFQKVSCINIHSKFQSKIKCFEDKWGNYILEDIFIILFFPVCRKNDCENWGRIVSIWFWRSCKWFRRGFRTLPRLVSSAHILSMFPIPSPITGMVKEYIYSSR